VNAKAEIKIGKQSLIRPQKKIPVSANILEKIVYIGTGARYVRKKINKNTI